MVVALALGGFDCCNDCGHHDVGGWGLAWGHQIAGRFDGWGLYSRIDEDLVGFERVGLDGTRGGHSVDQGGGFGCSPGPGRGVNEDPRGVLVCGSYYQAGKSVKLLASFISLEGVIYFIGIAGSRESRQSSCLVPVGIEIPPTLVTRVAIVVIGVAIVWVVFVVVMAAVVVFVCILVGIVAGVVPHSGLASRSVCGIIWSISDLWIERTVRTGFILFPAPAERWTNHLVLVTGEVCGRQKPGLRWIWRLKVELGGSDRRR